MYAQKVVYACYHNLSADEVGTWQVFQSCNHNDKDWWCFEPSHLLRYTDARDRAKEKPGPMPVETADALYVARGTAPSDPAAGGSASSSSTSSSPRSDTAV